VFRAFTPGFFDAVSGTTKLIQQRLTIKRKSVIIEVLDDALRRLKRKRDSTSFSGPLDPRFVAPFEELTETRILLSLAARCERNTSTGHRKRFLTIWVWKDQVSDLLFVRRVAAESSAKRRSWSEDRFAKRR
jgi:hypothetical protein